MNWGGGDAEVGNHVQPIDPKEVNIRSLPPPSAE